MSTKIKKGTPEASSVIVTSPDSIDKNSSLDQVIKFSETFRKKFLNAAVEQMTIYDPQSTFLSKWEIIKNIHQTQYARKVSIHIMDNITLSVAWSQFLIDERDSWIKELTTRMKETDKNWEIKVID